MHSFQPYPTGLFEVNPFGVFDQDWAIVASGTKKESNLMTISWGGMGELWGKDVVYIFVRQSRYTKEFLDRNHCFSLSFFNADEKEALKYCGSHSGRDGDKWAASGLTPAFKLGIPYPDEARMVMLCSVLAQVPMGEETFLDKHIKDKWYADGDMHSMYVAEVIEIMAR